MRQFGDEAYVPASRGVDLFYGTYSGVSEY
jgi:hypothetical protein